MTQSKRGREDKRQKGQYMTPLKLAREIVGELNLDQYQDILEPSCGDGSFIHPIMQSIEQKADAKLLGIELDDKLAVQCRSLVNGRNAVIIQDDFFKFYLRSYKAQGQFDLVVGNPPFGGTFDLDIEDRLDETLGKRFGNKIKKETYSFFIVACIDLLRIGGRLTFICSNSLLTISTMKGLRFFLMQMGEVTLRDISEFSEETNYPMLVLDFVKGVNCGVVTRNSRCIPTESIYSTPNFSWGITPEFCSLFSGKHLGDYFIATSGMTTGKNHYFVREVSSQNTLMEPYNFKFYDAPVTLAYEVERARLGKISAKKRAQLRIQESEGKTETRVLIEAREEPLEIKIPNQNYKPYNKANGALIYSDPTYYIYWEDEGRAVLTYKKTGNWYLRGVGGAPYFGREGITWQLVGSRFTARYLPRGYILDSGAPVAVLREGVDREEIYFVLGWILTDTANVLLKTVINHTRNIQSKDFERMPYPYWVAQDHRRDIINLIRSMITDAQDGRMWRWGDQEFHWLEQMFSIQKDNAVVLRKTDERKVSQMSLFG